MPTEAEEIQRAKINAVVNFVRGVTVVIGAFPVGYGVLTLAFGGELWGSGKSPAYDAALSVPFAPQSWGVFALTCGLMILVAEYRQKHVLLSGACFLQGVWCFTFGVFFLKDCIENQNSFGAPGALLYISLGVIYYLRMVLAWIWR